MVPGTKWRRVWQVAWQVLWSHPITELRLSTMPKRCDPELLWLLISLLGGVVIAACTPTSTHTHDPAPWATLSKYTGWIYFMCWSVSFYPQVYLNWNRKSTVGLSFDYQLLNFVGFSCYAAFNCGLYWSPDIQQEYRQTHNNTNAAVQLNDVFFSIHALALTCVTLFQIYWYRHNTSVVVAKDTTTPYHQYQQPQNSMEDYPQAGMYGTLSTPPRTPTNTTLKSSSKYINCLKHSMYVVVGVFVISVAVVCTLTWVQVNVVALTWLNVLYYLSSAKLAVTIVKYIPQVYENYSRKSTNGWNIWNVLLDFSGGSLSIAQLLIDCGSTGNWAGITGDPVKFMLGFVSIVFDIIFMVQHYCIYRGGGGSRKYNHRNTSEALLSNQSFGSHAEDDEWMNIHNEDRGDAPKNLYDSWLDN